MKVTYLERSLFCEWYETKTLENVIKLAPHEKTDGLFVATLENGARECIYSDCIISVEQ